jgi:hypothetical protein
VVELDVAGARVTGAAEGADQPESAGGGLHDLRLEVVFGQVGGGAEDQILEDPLIARPVEGGGELGDAGRIAQDEPVHDGAGPLDQGVVVRIGGGIAGRETGQLGKQLGLVFPEDEAVVAAGQGCERARVARN